MAKQTVVTMIDDMDGSTDGVVTVRFGYAGQSYEIDLSQKNSDKLTKALAPFVAKARRSGGSSKPSARGKSSSDYDRAAYKAWLTDNDHPITRGRPKPELLAAYRAAGGK